MDLIKSLINKLKPKDYEIRKKEFEKVEDVVKQSGKNGGVFARFSRSFKVKGSKDERVDIEVLGGQAFVEDEDNKG